MVERKKPTGIMIENCENVTLTDNKGYGDMNHIVAKNSKDIEASGNELILDDDSQSEPMWYQKPLGVVAITVISGVLVALVIKAINHFTGSDLG